MHKEWGHAPKKIGWQERCILTNPEDQTFQLDGKEGPQFLILVSPHHSGFLFEKMDTQPVCDSALE